MNEPDALSKKVIGIIGGGQLGKMTAIAATKLGQKTHVFASAKDDPACSVADDFTIADFSDKKALESFAQSVDLVTIESENIPCSAIDIDVNFYPGKKALHIAQNRLREKDFIRSLSIKTAEYKSIQNYNELLKSSRAFGYPTRLKTTEMGYDGKGQYVLENDSEVKQFASFDWNTEYILEASVDLLKEVSIVVARDKNGKVAFFPIAENYHVDGIFSDSIVTKSTLCAKDSRAFLSEKSAIVKSSATEQAGSSLALAKTCVFCPSFVAAIAVILPNCPPPIIPITFLLSASGSFIL